MLNALDLAASAVGNHEFDRGYADLVDRVIAGGENAQWPYLGANVYEKGTENPALDEYTVLDVDGVRVAVVGAVTQETPTLVTPGGIATADIGDPVEAEDVVQQAWLRLDATATVVENLPAWLTTVTTRLCLDRLKARTPLPVDDVVQEPLFDDPLAVVARAFHPLSRKSGLTLGEGEGEGSDSGGGGLSSGGLFCCWGGVASKGSQPNPEK